jgi:hypothetical protein
MALVKLPSNFANERKDLARVVNMGRSMLMHVKHEHDWLFDELVASVKRASNIANKRNNLAREINVGRLTLMEETVREKRAEKNE